MDGRLQVFTGQANRPLAEAILAAVAAGMDRLAASP